MKKQWLFTCMTAFLLAHTSCVTDESIMEMGASNVESRNCTEEEQVHSLVEQARQGEAEAYKSLAFCYRDGKGVEKSYLNAIFMYLVYCQKTGQELKTGIELFEEGNPYRLLIEILNSPELNQETLRKVDQLQLIAPAEAKTLRAMIDQHDNNDNNNNVLNILQEAESEGSELARLVQAFYYEESKDTIMYQQCLFRTAEKHPFLYPQLARIFEEKYYEDEDFTNIQKAMEYYYKTDSYGMLAPRQANNLWSIYDYFSKKGLLEYDEQEVERLKKIIKTEKGK